MLTLAEVAISTFLLALALTPLCRAVSKRLGWVDHPGDRKVHRKPIPRTGGIVIFFVYAAALALLRFTPLRGGHSYQGELHWVHTLLPGILTAFITGLIDDIFGLKPWMKITGQAIAAVLVSLAGVQIGNIGGYSFTHTIWPVIFTVIWLVGCANAFNLIDGLDGLAAGVGLFATATAFVSALLSHNTALALVTAPLLGALLGFLPYNFNPASIFMGDCGSLTVGFLLGCFGIIWSQKSATALGMTAPLIALAIPLLDTGLAIARRFLRRQEIFSADRRHIHHRLLARGFTPRRVAYTIYAGAGVVAALSLLISSAHVGGFALIVFCAIAWFAIQYLGYEEFDTARAVLFGGILRRAVNGRLSVGQIVRSIQAARTVDECWAAIHNGSRPFGFAEVTLGVNGQRFTARFNDACYDQCWNLTIPLGAYGYLDWSIPFNAQPTGTIEPLTTTLRKALVQKLAEIASQQLAAPSVQLPMRSWLNSSESTSRQQRAAAAGQ